MRMLNFFDKPVVLASQSPRRAELLRMLNIDFTIHHSQYTEENNLSYAPEELALRHARAKAQAVAPFYPSAWIIGADTIVVLGERIFGKPQDRKAAFQMLRQLSGQTHTVYTAYCILNSSNQKYLQRIVATAVTFKHLTDEEIDYYIDQFPPYDKAGAYGIQDFSAVFVEKIDGCFYNVVGFPLADFYDLVYRELEKIL